MRWVGKISLLFVFILSLAGLAFAQGQNMVTVQGTIQEIAADGSYMMVDNKKIYTTADFAEEAYLEVGDMVKIEAENSQEGLKAVSYEYIFDDEEEAYEEE